MLDTNGYEDALEKYIIQDGKIKYEEVSKEKVIQVTEKLLQEQRLATLRKCRDMKILTMDEPIPINRIFVKVNVLKRGLKHNIVSDLLSRRTLFNWFGGREISGQADWTTFTNRRGSLEHTFGQSDVKFVMCLPQWTT